MHTRKQTSFIQKNLYGLTPLAILFAAYGKHVFKFNLFLLNFPKGGRSEKK